MPQRHQSDMISPCSDFNIPSLHIDQPSDRCTTPTTYISSSECPGIQLEVDLCFPNSQLQNTHNTHPMVTRSKSSLNSSNLCAYLSTQTVLVEPKSATEALNTPEWKDAMLTEYNALMNNQTWELVPCMPGMNIVSSKWVFKTKLNSDGSLQRY